jgi:hypothetical protein
VFPVFDLAEIAEEAAERAGIEFRAGYALRSARRSLELLSIEWGNRGLNLWTIETDAIPLLQGVPEYSIPDDTIDLIEHSLRRSDGQSEPHDYPLARMSISDYETVPNKTTQGRPTIIYIRRTIHPTFILWEVPNQDGYSLRYARLRRLAGVGQGGAGVPEVPFRFVPALTAGLAYYLALKSTDPNAMQRIATLKTFYEEQFTLASDEDRDRAPVRWVPWGYPL